MRRMNRTKLFMDALKFKGNSCRSFLETSLLYSNSSNYSTAAGSAKLNDALNLFKNMTQQKPLPYADEFTKLLEVIKKHDPHFYRKGLVSYTTLLDGLISESRINEAHGLFKKLVQDKLCQPDTVMCNTIIKALCCSPPINNNNRVLPFKMRMDHDFPIDNNISPLALNMKMNDALKILKHMISQPRISPPDVVTYNSLISGRCKQTHWWDAKALLHEMFDRSISPNLETFNILVNEFCKNNRIQVAHEVIYLMQERGILPNTQTFNSLVAAYSLTRKFTKARSLIDLMMSRDITAPNAATYDILLYVYCEDMKMDDAMLIYLEMSERGLKPGCLTYNTMIKILFSVARSEEARKLLDDMRAQGQMLDSLTYECILYDLCREDLFEEALSLFHFVGDDGKLNSDIGIHNSLIDAAIKYKKLHIARELFKDLSVKGMEPDHQTYTTMIDGFCGEGLMQDAKQLFLKLQESGSRPTTDTYNLLLQGYLKAKFYDDVKMLLNKMARTHHRLDESTFSLLRDSVEAGLLDTAMLTLIDKLAPLEEMDYSSSSD